jgi:hypothetical protein
MLADDIGDRIAAACPAEIDDLIRDAWCHHVDGRLSETDMEIIDEAARARREAFQARRTETRPKPRAAPSSAPPRPARPRRAIPRSPDRAASQQRRRDVGQERWLPPNIASQLTQGEIAVLSVMVHIRKPKLILRRFGWSLVDWVGWTDATSASMFGGTPAQATRRR